MDDFIENINGISASNALTVSQLTIRIKNTLYENFPGLWVKGEVSNFYCHNKRHLYFDLKDADAKIRVVMFYAGAKNLGFEIEDGLQLNLYGSISVYEKRGEYQLIAEIAEKVRSGDMLLALEELRKKLKGLGYFDHLYKKPVPLLPGKIGAITSTGGAVIRDIITVLTERFENFHLVVRNVNVQGSTSADEICDAVDDLERYGADVIIIARGGGSLEDLWAFNTEKVAKKVFECSIPVISAVGHETDHTICDDVADLRAATPSVAAAFAIMNKQDHIARINQLLKRAQDLVKNKITRACREIDFLVERRIFKKPQSVILKNIQDFELLQRVFFEKSKAIVKSRAAVFDNAAKSLDSKYILSRIKTGMIITANNFKKLYPLFNLTYTSKKNNINMLLKDLHSAGPLNAIEKGYAIITDIRNNKHIKSVSAVKTGQDINIVLKDGRLLSRILEKVNKKPNWDGKNDN